MKGRARLIAATLLVAGMAAPIAVQRMRGTQRLEVEIAPVRAMRLTPTVLATGVLAYTSQVTLMPQILGRVETIHVTEGQQVRAGEAVLELDARDARAEVAQFVAAENQARIDVRRAAGESAYRATRAERYRALRAQGIVTVAQYDEYAHAEDLASAQWQNARQALLRASAQSAQAREALARTAILAPMDGQVSAIETRVGETVVPSVSNVPGSVLLTISNPSEQLAEVEIDEADIARVRIGQPARVTIASDPDRTFPATVQKMAVLPTVLPRGRVYKTRLRLADAGLPAFHPGMGCRAEVDVGTSAQVVAVPQQAVLSTPGDPRTPVSVVFVVADGVATRRRVATASSDDENVEIASGLTPRESIVVGPASALHRLQDGQRVSPAPRQNPSPAPSDAH